MRFTWTGAARAAASESVLLPSTSLTVSILPLFSASESVPLNEDSAVLALVRLSAVESNTVRILVSCLPADFVVLLRSPNAPFRSVAVLLSAVAVLLIESEMSLSCGLSWLSKSVLMPSMEAFACWASWLTRSRSAVVSLTFASILSALVLSEFARSLSCVMVAPTLVLR